MVTLKGQQSGRSEGDEIKYDDIGQMPTETRVDLEPLNHDGQFDSESSTRLNIEDHSPSALYDTDIRSEIHPSAPPFGDVYSEASSATSPVWSKSDLLRREGKLPPLTLYEPEELTDELLVLYGLGPLASGPSDRFNDGSAIAQNCTDEVLEVQEDDDESIDDSSITSDVEPDDALSNRGWISDVPSTANFQQRTEVCTPGGLVLPPAEAPSFGSVCVTKSNNVHMGNKMFYKNVTIKQFIYSNKNADDAGDGTYTANGEAPGIEQNSTNNPEDPIKGESQNNELVGRDTNSAKVSNGWKMHPLYLPRQDKVAQWIWMWRCAAIICAISLVLVSVIVIGTIILMKRSNDSDYNVSPSGQTDPEHDVVVNSVRFIQRIEWLAQPPLGKIPKRSGEAEYVIVGHTATDPCDTQTKCMLRVRYIQMSDIESKSRNDIAYNFLIGGDGLVYVGRGWNQAGEISPKFDSKSINIMLIGTFKIVAPTERQNHALKNLIEFGVSNKSIAVDYKLLGEKQVSSANGGSPGDVVYDTVIKVHSHWTEIPDSELIPGI